VRVKAAGRQPSPGSGRGFCNGGNATHPATFRDAQLSSAVARPGFGWAGTFHPGAPDQLAEATQVLQLREA